MQVTPGNEVPTASLPSLGQPTLLVEWSAGHRVFLQNLGDVLLFRRPTQPRLTSRPAPFWPDVFVERGVAWRSMASSALYHVFVVTVIYGMSVTWAQRRPLPTRSPFDNSKITYYSVSEYLPEIDTGSAPAPAKEERKGEPKYAKQRIISLPPAPDNFHQTIITQSQIKLPNDVSMPNLVAWTPVPSPVPESAMTSQPKLPAIMPEVIAPAPSAEALRSKPALPNMQAEVVPPAPSAEALRSNAALPNMQPEVVAPVPSVDSAKSNARLPNIPQPSVIEPPVPASAATRPVGTMNVARLDPTIGAPKLPVAEQRAATAGSAGSGNRHGGSQNAVVQSPPNLAGIGNGKQAVGQLIALGLDPVAVNGPISVPNGSRHGQFAATPEGKADAPGTPDIKGGGIKGGGGGNGGGGGSSPPGISVGPAPSQTAGVVMQGNPADAPNTAKQATVVASLEPSRVADMSRASRLSPASLDAPGKIEDKVFGGKRYYSMTLNMPNLTSAGGSWIIRFAELNESPASGAVIAPQPRVKVDPAYPADLMRDRVEGTVTLYAVIHRDGSVGEVKVLRGVDQRLDENARIALSRWKFQPATKNGSAVDLEAVVQIPFAARKLPF